MSTKLSCRASQLALAIMLALVTAQAQNSAPATDLSRRDRLAAAAQQLQPDPQLQPLDAPSSAWLDRSVQSNLLDQVGDASQPGVPVTAADQQIPVVLQRRRPAGSTPARAAPPSQDDFASQSVASTEVITAAPLPPQMSLAQPVSSVAPSPQVLGTFPLPPGSIRGSRSRDQITHRESPKARTTSREPASLDALTRAPLSGRSDSRVTSTSHTHASTSQSQVRKRPHHRLSASPFSTFTSSE